MAIVAYLTGAFVSVVLWHHFAKVLDVWFTPVWILDSAYRYGARLFHLFGNWFAYISSYLTYLKLDELFISTCDVLRALWRLLFVWLEFVKGYYDAISEYKWTTSTIVCGSITVIAAIACILYRFRDRLFTQAFQARILHVINYVFPSEWSSSEEDEEEEKKDEE